MKKRARRTILERTLAELSSLLLELLDGTLVDTTALVDQVTGGGGLAGIDVTDNWRGGARLGRKAIAGKETMLTDDVDMALLLAHF